MAFKRSSVRSRLAPPKYTPGKHWGSHTKPASHHGLRAFSLPESIFLIFILVSIFYIRLRSFWQNLRTDLRPRVMATVRNTMRCQAAVWRGDVIRIDIRSPFTGEGGSYYEGTGI